MAPKSPTHAFDPTPALEHNQYNYSPLNDNTNHDGSPKEVRFKESPIFPSQARHSIATTNVPLLPAVSSASQLPKQSFRMTNSNQEINITAYIENCRNLNEQLRQAHETERRSWEIERTALQARIADLEFKLNKSRDTKRRLSNDSSTTASAQSFRSDFRISHSTNSNNVPTRSSSESVVSNAIKSWKPPDSHQPVWKGPEYTPPVTRVFTNEDDINHLPPISEDEPLPSLSREISPTSGGVERTESLTIPIEQVDRSLDGITLKSSALTSSFIAKITSPRQGSPAQSPSPQPKNAAGTGNETGLKVKLTGLLSPLDQKLKLNAGHTPMAYDGSVSSQGGSTALATPKADEPAEPAEPAPSTRPPPRPSEGSDSYFSFVSQCDTSDEIKEEAMSEVPQHENLRYTTEDNDNNIDDDPSLQGPLILDSSAKTEAAQSFLDKVDAKLKVEAAKNDELEREEQDHDNDKEKSQNDGIITNGHINESQDQNQNQNQNPNQSTEMERKDDEMPMLKIKNSKNFGSAWGGDMPGKI